MNDGEQQLRRVEHTGRLGKSAAHLRRQVDHRASSASYRTRRVLTIWWSPCATLRGKHPSFVSCFHDQQPLGQCDELPAVVTVFWRPALHHPPLEVICQHWRIALVETRQLFHIRDREHGFTRLTLFRHISPLSRWRNESELARVRGRRKKNNTGRESHEKADLRNQYHTGRM